MHSFSSHSQFVSCPQLPTSTQQTTQQQQQNSKTDHSTQCVSYPGSCPGPWSIQLLPYHTQKLPGSCQASLGRSNLTQGSFLRLF
jgi:hypothetical protein